MQEANSKKASIRCFLTGDELRIESFPFPSTSHNGRCYHEDSSIQPDPIELLHATAFERILTSVSPSCNKGMPQAQRALSRRNVRGRGCYKRGYRQNGEFFFQPKRCFCGVYPFSRQSVHNENQTINKMLFSMISTSHTMPSSRTLLMLRRNGIGD